MKVTVCVEKPTGNEAVGVLKEKEPSRKGVEASDHQFGTLMRPSEMTESASVCPKVIVEEVGSETITGVALVTRTSMLTVTGSYFSVSVGMKTKFCTLSPALGAMLGFSNTKVPGTVASPPTLRSYDASVWP